MVLIFFLSSLFDLFINTLETLNFFAVLTSLTFKIAKGSASVISDLITRLQVNTTERTTIRLNVYVFYKSSLIESILSLPFSLVNIYNLDQDATRKFSTLLAILNYARLTNQGDALLAQFQSVEEWEREVRFTFSFFVDINVIVTFIC